MADRLMEFVVPLLIVIIGLEVVQLYYLQVFRTRQVEIRNKLGDVEERTRELTDQSSG